MISSDLNEVLLKVRKLDVDEVKKIIEKEFVSAIGHVSTAEVLSKLLNKKITANRIQVKLQEKDIAIIFQLMMRLDEGRILSEEEIAKLPFVFYSVEII
jgi:PIN domain nuclease of toxin-antitoxin system